MRAGRSGRPEPRAARIALVLGLALCGGLVAPTAGAAAQRPPEPTAGAAQQSPQPTAGAAQQPPQPTAVWLDVDPSTAPGGYELVINDDGLAIVQALHSPELDVRGVSAVFGNAALEETYPVAREVVERFAPATLQVFAGADGAAQLGEETDASRALASALRREPLTVLALGPVTNVATVVLNHPDLHARIERIVAVAGRRPGQRFVASTTTSEPLMDLNFELDPDGFRVLLESGIPIVLAPFEVSSKVLLVEADMDRLRQGGEGARWLAAPAAGWLEWWQRRFSVEGFYPFDTLAVAYVTTPQWLACETAPAEIQMHPDDVKVPSMGASAPEKPYLLVAPSLASDRMVTYCHDVDPAFKPDLMERLLAQP